MSVFQLPAPVREDSHGRRVIWYDRATSIASPCRMTGRCAKCGAHKGDKSDGKCRKHLWLDQPVTAATIECSVDVPALTIDEIRSAAYVLGLPVDNIDVHTPARWTGCADTGVYGLTECGDPAMRIVCQTEEYPHGIHRTQVYLIWVR